jgi:hypothetical protein
MTDAAWPELSFDAWRETGSTLHLWTQIVGKIRLSLTPWVNHSWHVPLYLTARGLTTSPIPWRGTSFQIDFDFVSDNLLLYTSGGESRLLALAPMTVADFYRDLFARLAEVGIGPRIYARPNEVENAIPFAEDREHASYDAQAVHRFWRALAAADRVFKQFRARFIGKASPVHFFWGSFDLAVTRFSGRTAPPHPGGTPNLPDWVAREAYSHEVSSCGFWPGAEAMPKAVFYAYAYPEPSGFASWPVRPAEAGYDAGMGEFILPYDDVRRARSPEEALLDFCQSTYEAAAENANWDRKALEKEFRRDTVSPKKEAP